MLGFSAHKTWVSGVTALVAIAVCLLTAKCSSNTTNRLGSSGSQAAGVAARGQIHHVIIIVQENRSFDNIFGGWDSTQCPGPAPFKPGVADSTIPSDIRCSMHSQEFGEPGEISANHDVWECLSKHGFTADAWKRLDAKNCPGGDVHGANPFNYLEPELRTTYWDIATKYVLGDKFFAVTNTASFPGHQYIVAAQSVDEDDDIVADQPNFHGTSTGGNGCVDKDIPNLSIDVPALGPNGYIETRVRGLGGECYTHKTLADLLDTKQVSWEHYTTLQWDANTGAYDQRGVFDGFINMDQWYQKTNLWPTSMNDLKDDIANNALPQITWIKPPCVALSDHPHHVSTNDSANWVGSVVNWIGNSKAWDDTVVFVIWDDWGGFYDHVAPPPLRINDDLGPGVRIPFLMISPYGQNGSVIHQLADYGSILKFIEDLYGLPPLTTVDSNASDLAPFFDFTKKKDFVPVYVKTEFVPSMCPPYLINLQMIDK